MARQDVNDSVRSGADRTGPIGKQPFELPNSINGPPSGFVPDVSIPTYGEYSDESITDYHPPVEATENLHPFKTTFYLNDDDEPMVRVRIGRLFYTPSIVYISKIRPHGPHGEKRYLMANPVPATDDTPFQAANSNNIPPGSFEATAEAGESEDDNHTHKVPIDGQSLNRAAFVAESALTGIDRGVDLRGDEERFNADNDARDNPLGLWPTPTWRDASGLNASGGGAESGSPAGIWGWEAGGTGMSPTATFASGGLTTGEGVVPKQFYSVKEGSNEVPGSGSQKNMYADIPAPSGDPDADRSVWLVYVLKADPEPQLFSGNDSIHSKVQIHVTEGTEPPTMYGQLAGFSVGLVKEPDISPVEGVADEFYKNELMLGNSIHEDADVGISSLDGFGHLAGEGTAKEESYKMGVYYIKIAEISQMNTSAADGEEPVMVVDQILHDNVFLHPVWVVPSGELPKAPGFGEEGDPVELPPQ